MTEKLHIGQGRAGLRRKHGPDRIDQPFDVTRRIPERSKMAAGITNNPQHISAMCDRRINNDKSFHQMSYCACPTDLYGDSKMWKRLFQITIVVVIT